MNNNKELEIRNIQGNITRSDDTRHVEGYALVFDSRSEDLGFYEYIDRDAIAQDMINSCDVFALLNHDDNKVLARSYQGSGSLSLEVDDKGLYYSFDAPNTALGDELLEYLKRGEIFGSSFAFYVDYKDESAQTWERKDGVNYRYIHKIAYIHDVSPVFSPAYSATSVSQRSLDKCKEIEDFENEQRNLEEQKKQEIIDSLDAKLQEINDITNKFTV